MFYFFNKINKYVRNLLQGDHDKKWRILLLQRLWRSKSKKIASARKSSQSPRWINRRTIQIVSQIQRRRISKANDVTQSDLSRQIISTRKRNSWKLYRAISSMGSIVSSLLKGLKKVVQSHRSTFSETGRFIFSFFSLSSLSEPSSR